MNVGQFLRGLQDGGYWDERCVSCGDTFTAPEGQKHCPPCRTYVDCKFCGRQVDVDLSHLHQDRWVGPCCWDERLRCTE